MNDDTCRRYDCRSREGAIDDDLFVALRDLHRRYALYYLLEHDDVSIEELADVVTGWNSAARDDTATRADRDRIYADLVHRHVPLLADAGLLAHDAAAGIVSLECADTAREFVRLAHEYETDTTPRAP